MINPTATHEKPNVTTPKLVPTVVHIDQTHWSQVLQNAQTQKAGNNPHIEKDSKLKPAPPAPEVNDSVSIPSLKATIETQPNKFKNGLKGTISPKAPIHERLLTIQGLPTIPNDTVHFAPPAPMTNSADASIHAGRDSNTARTRTVAADQTTVSGQTISNNQVALRILKALPEETSQYPEKPSKFDHQIVQTMNGNTMTNFGIVPPNNLSSLAPTTHAAIATQILATPIEMNDAAKMTAGLTASIAILHKTGNNSAILNLSPPGLGNLSIHVGTGESAVINILFVTANPQTGQILNAHLGDLRQAINDAGLSLGDAQVSYGNDRGNSRQKQQPTVPNARQAATNSNPEGIRAFA
ncbi:MAG: hypothetical protein B7Z75_07070 [Acidocella sp. 20-57-95]|nr:MAG: hypothetical protein B7Z75_07070 [Acidocella sp. 20-57-95]HQT63564.1 flagellar hook-length control protein FliK [Acidocella sp.]